MLKLILSTTILFAVACSGLETKCKETAHVNDAECKALAAAVDCTKGEIPSVIAEFLPVVEFILKEATGADGSIDASHVEDGLKTLGGAYGSCVVAELTTKFLVAPPKATRGEVVPNSMAVRELFEHLRAKNFDGKSFHTSNGDI